ncbi:SMI1/KNR4 family protein [Bacillus sp. DX1.1]|uniref:SMI1/KNR4 family protein n=1 Tax=unclassified Bacillus (in: firmicutes) TaxID=185979 RepID=UPI0025703A14|nr:MULTISPECIES: SMI1/KNR4 family protein [unclassified Bacillus (in: firmicutes)]MDM5154748.1 SMI1/KNR4 family protein [Bacillus sp. DX1.1]WJE83630.1 SMI1/KNR4 family protein [Bacillus sp. DX3.1]
MNLFDILTVNKKDFKSNKQEEWDTVEKNLGMILPLDYKKFINKYGTGSINDFIWILNPFSENENLNLIKKGHVIREAYAYSKKQFPDDFIHNVYPVNNGLLPCAITDNGDEIYWLTNEECDQWRIIVYDSRSNDYYEYNNSMTEFLYKVISKEIICPVFPNDLFKDGCQFINL